MFGTPAAALPFVPGPSPDAPSASAGPAHTERTRRR